MNSMNHSKLSSSFQRGTTLSLILVLLVSISSCNTEDPSFEKEALKLTAEKAALEVRLEESEKQKEALQSQLSQAQVAVSSANSKVTAAKSEIDNAKGQIDVEKIKLGFAKAVSDLGAKIELKHPDYTVESVTFQKMKLPTDYPFSSGVMTTLISKSSGKKQILYWEAQGNTQGVWRFANREKPRNSVAADTPATPQSTVIGNNPVTPQRPATPAQPTRPAKPTRIPTRTDGNTHIIDWGNLK